MMAIFTIGHSNLPLELFMAALTDAPFPVEVLIDVRSHPTSRHPQFVGTTLDKSLPKMTTGRVGYLWVPGLGGWDVRHGTSPLLQKFGSLGVDVGAYTRGAFPKQHIASGVQASSSFKPSWTNVGLFDYSWFMSLPEFVDSAERLIQVGKLADVAIMCCEALWWKCHRSMIADYLHWRGVEAIHLTPKLTGTGTDRVAFHGDVMTYHSTAIGNRIERYDRRIIESWKGHLEELVSV